MKKSIIFSFALIISFLFFSQNQLTIEDNYKNGSRITQAKKLQGDLMIIRGKAFENVQYQSFERITN